MKSLMLIVLISLTSLIMTSCYEEVCSPNPCLNEGVCSEVQGAYSCECKEGFSGDNCEIKECACTKEYIPVCGKDGKTYGNACELACSNTELDHKGECVNVNGCSSNSDCSTNQVCKRKPNATLGKCVEYPTGCQADSDCERGEICDFSYSNNNYGKCVENPVCGDIMCDLYCENGFKKNDLGCEVCECVENPECRMDADCTENEICINGVCKTTIHKCKNDAECEIGEICKLSSNNNYGKCVEKPVCGDIMCDLYCENGFKKNDLGCEICECVEIFQCESNSDCNQDEVCIDNLCKEQLLSCGGIAGLTCPDGMECRYENDGPDAMGKCVPSLSCGGIAGLTCPDGMECRYENDGPDAMGKCIVVENPCSVVECQDGMYCEVQNGQAVCIPSQVNNCELNTDCNDGEECVQGVCKEKKYECGGIAGLTCPDGMECRYENDGPDAMGKCVPFQVNECSSNADCQMGQLCSLSESGVGSCEACNCDSSFEPVCGVNGVTYSNRCVAECSRADVLHQGQCR